MRQRVTNEIVTRERLDEAFSGLVMTDRFVNRLGPAVNSGNAILIYGPAVTARQRLPRSLEIYSRMLSTCPTASISTVKS